MDDPVHFVRGLSQVRSQRTKIRFFRVRRAERSMPKLPGGGGGGGVPYHVTVKYHRWPGDPTDASSINFMPDDPSTGGFLGPLNL